MPIVTISGGSYCGGEAVASGVARLLGHRFAPREVIYGPVARDWGVSAEEFIAAMERRRPIWGRVTGNRTDHVKRLRTALSEFARGGKVVYYGYLGHLLLPPDARVLRVRIITDRDTRLQAAMQRQGISRVEAARHLDKVDSGRREWTRFLFDVDWDDPAQFDFVLNRDRLSIASACELVAQIAVRPEFLETGSSLQAVDDMALASQVEMALHREPRTTGVALHVTANDGIVTISGKTQSLTAVEAVSRIVAQMEGVRELKNEVEFTGELMSVPY